MTDIAPDALPLRTIDATDGENVHLREWLITNGLGGYACGTIGGISTRRYHSILVSAQPEPLGRMLMLKHLYESILLPDGSRFYLGEQPGITIESAKSPHLVDFRLDAGMPVWRYALDGLELERRIVMVHRQNTTFVCYRLLKAETPVTLELRPAVRFRPHDSSYDAKAAAAVYALTLAGNRYEISANNEYPVLRLKVHGQEETFITDGGQRREIFFRTEAERGYESHDLIWDPGHFVVPLQPGRDCALIASTEDWDRIESLTPQEAVAFEQERAGYLLARAQPELREGFGADLVLAADRFLFEPAGRKRERVKAQATGDAVRAVIAGYHWFTDWGRDTMISLEGLTLVTGRAAEAGWILRSINRYVRDGLIPNLFPEGADGGLYHTADASLWFFHALERYVAYTGDRRTLRLILPQLVSIADHHLAGTRFGIGVDPADGLLRQGAEGYQLTWMDAKVEDWVVTPRRGKAVEINALWYNALCLLSGWLSEEKGPTGPEKYAQAATQARASFDRRFWYSDGNYCYDVVDGEQGDDPALRPNQILVFALKHKILDEKRWPQVLAAVKDKLLTPMGLRTLSPDHPDYKKQYFGDLRSRDAAYHQGTVWPWLIGPFVDAWLACHPGDIETARGFLAAFDRHLVDNCVGTISEICDAEAPYTPRGCVAQAWSVAEVLRAWAKTAPNAPKI